MARSHAARVEQQQKRRHTAGHGGCECQRTRRAMAKAARKTSTRLGRCLDADSRWLRILNGLAFRRGRRLAAEHVVMQMVGAEGFEPPTLCSQSRCATRLRYAPTWFFDCIANGNEPKGERNPRAHQITTWWLTHKRSQTNTTMGIAKTSAIAQTSAERKAQSFQVWRRGCPICRCMSW